MWLRYDKKMTKTGTFHVISGLLPWFSEFYFLTDFFAWPFYLVTWHDLDLYYGRKAE